MATQKYEEKKDVSRNVLHFWMPVNPKPQLSWFFKDIWKTFRKSKTGGSRESFLLENEFRACYTVTFPKKPQRFWMLGNQPKAWNLHFNFFHMLFYIWTQHNIKLSWALKRNLFKVLYILKAKFKTKISQNG